MMNKMDKSYFIYICYVIFILFIPLCDGRRYRNFTLYRAIPIVETHLNFFRELNKFYEVVFWRGPGNLYSPIDFIISPNDKMMFLMEVDKQKIFLATIMPDVQTAFDEQIQPYAPYIPKDMKSFNWKSYARLDDIYTWMNDLTQKFPREITVFNIGTTYEGRQIKAARVVLEGARRGSKIIIEGGIHAREWISPAFVTYLLNEVLNSTNSKDEAFKEIATNYEWYFIPVLNPDGYEFSHVKDRLWRKNRRPFGTNVIHYGVDLNRNFGIAFGSVGTTRSDPADDTYCGPKPFSELESWAMAEFMKNMGHETDYYISIHSYGQLIILPYGYTTKHYADYDQVLKLCKQSINIISQRRSTKFRCGNSFSTLGYMASGVSSDWAKMAYGIPYVLDIEMQDEGRYGYALPPSEIIPSSVEVIDGLKELIGPKSERFYRLAENNDLSSSPCFVSSKNILIVFLLLHNLCLVLILQS